MIETFENFLMDKCPCHTNNGPEGFERWESELDIQDVEDYAEEYGEMKFIEGKKAGIDDMCRFFKEAYTSKK